MLAGISTACLYPELTERALDTILRFGIQSTELFFNAFSELNPNYLRELRQRADDCGTRILSIHPFTSAMEPLLFFSGYYRRFEDGLEFYKQYFEAANLLGAEILVFHGDRREAQRPYESYFDRFAMLMEAGRRMGVTVAQENVPRCASWQPHFFEQMRRALPQARFVLDVKQCLRGGFSAEEMAQAMGDGLVHVHLSDHCAGQDCLPIGKGDMNLPRLLQQFRKQGFDGGVILELYRNNYRDFSELDESYRKILDAISKQQAVTE